MVRLAVIGALLLAGCASAAMPDDAAAVVQPGPLALPAIEYLTITENGMGSSTDAAPALECSGFVLDEAQVRRFLGEAGEVGQRDYMHALDWSPCHARGRVELADGRSGIWTIRQFQTGSIVFDQGGETFLFCPSCTWKPFAW